MLKAICLAGVLLAAPALAEPSCGNAPIAPAIPGNADISGKTPDDAHKVVHSAFESVRAYQTSLGTYRSCMEVQKTNARAAVAAAQTKGDKTKIADAQAQVDGVDKQLDSTVDTEEQVVKDYTNLHNSYCAMGPNLAGCGGK